MTFTLVQKPLSQNDCEVGKFHFRAGGYSLDDLGMSNKIPSKMYWNQNEALLHSAQTTYSSKQKGLPYVNVAKLCVFYLTEFQSQNPFRFNCQSVKFIPFLL